MILGVFRFAKKLEILAQGPGSLYFQGLPRAEPSLVEPTGDDNSATLAITVQIRICVFFTYNMSWYSYMYTHTNSGCGKERRILVGPW